MSDETAEREASDASEWQQRITGEWYGIPSVFDADGNHTGFNKVNRSSVFEDGITTYYMHCDFRNVGPLRSRFEISDFAFGVDDQGNDRIYLGPDFFGAGHPYGSIVDSHYYSPAWRTDLNTLNQILPDGVTQVYSSLLYEGPTIVAVFNGVYQNALDYDTNPDTTARIDAFLEAEESMAKKPHVLPDRTPGRWAGTCEAYGPDQQKSGEVEVTIDHRPIDLVRAEQTWTMSGDVNRTSSYTRTRIGNRHTYDGPDLYGNPMGYGRAIYTTQHHCTDAFKVKGREFLIDDAFTMAVAWKLYDGDRMTHLVHGALTWTPET
ncbi:MAG: hypothetical protein ACR2O6_14575 [Ilumatobacteraceae bacterium]